MENENGKGFLKPFARAVYPCLWVRTVEGDRFIESSVQELKGFRHCMTWDFNRGFKQEPHDEMPRFDFGQKPGQMFVQVPPEQILARAITGPEKAVWFLQNFHWDIESPTVIQEILNLLPALKSNQIMICIVSPVLKLPVELQRIFTVLDFNLPTKEDLKKILDRTAKGNNIEVVDEKAILEAASGLTWEETENALSLSIVKCRGFNPKYITEQKAQMIKKSAALKLANFKETFKDIGGLDNLKNWLLNRFLNKQEDLPWRGVLLLGVPGTGKSSLAKALANEVKRACVEMSFSSMFGSLVGESEGRMREALAVIDAMEPLITFVDKKLFTLNCVNCWNPLRA